MAVVNVLLHSGGLDSHICWLLTRWQPVYVRYGSEAEDSELRALRWLSELVAGFNPIVVDGPVLGAQADGHVAHRNLALLTTTAATTGASRLAYGALLGEGSPDKSVRFRVAASLALSASEHRRIRVVAPLGRYTKTGALVMALRRFPDLRPLLPVLVACYHGRACGACQGCYRRALAEWAAGLRSAPPPRPTETFGPIATLRGNSPLRWPSLAVANWHSARAEFYLWRTG